MDSGIEWLEGLSNGDHALIGKFVVGFAVLERSIGLLINSFAHCDTTTDIDDPQSSAAKKHAEDLGRTMGQQIEVLRIANGRLPQPARVSECDLEKLRALADYRNLICHGVWRRDEAGLTVVWFDREQIEKLRDVSNEPAVGPKHMKLEADRSMAILRDTRALACNMLAKADQVRNSP